MSNSKQRIAATDVLSFKQVNGVQLSPDARLAAFVVGDAFTDGAKLPCSAIWTVPTDGGEPRQFTFGPRRDTLPGWSPDGRTLAFLSDRAEAGQYQVYLLARDGGEARALTDIHGAIPTARGLISLQWSPDGRYLACLMEDPLTDADKQRLQDTGEALEFEQNPKFVRLWVVDVVTGELRAVTPEGVQVWEFSWSPDGRHFAIITSDAPYEWAWYTARLARIPFSGGQAQALYSSRRQIARPVWSPDGEQIAFVSSLWSDRGVIAGDLWLTPAGGGEARPVTAGKPFSVSWAEWQPAGKGMLVLAVARDGLELGELDVVSGEWTPLWADQVAFAEQYSQRYSGVRGGFPLAAVRESTDRPRDVWLARRDSGQVRWTQLTHLHPHADQFELGATESVTWQARDGLEIDGLLVKPPGYQPGRRYPLVVWVHGGPTSAHTWRYYGAPGWIQLFAASGLAVLLANPRGSIGRGLEFAEANVGDLGGEDFQDLMRGVDHCLRIGVADPDRLGIGGWSYGGFMTAWAITHTDRFRAAVVGAGIANWQSFHGNSSLCAWDAIHYDTDPYSGDTYRRFSPITHIRSAKTPTLIVHGEKDGDVPVGQAYEFFRALKDLGVETQLVVYPREAHGPVEKKHLLDLARRVTGWFEGHLQ